MPYIRSGIACILLLCFFEPAAAFHHKSHRHHVAHHQRVDGYETATVDDGRVIGARPDGCPHAYCGCGLRKYLGLSDQRLNLASNWGRFFARTPAPRPGLVAVRNHHVMYLESQAANGEWVVRDFNSGGGLSRIHTRDVRGYVFVDPRAEASAMPERTGVRNDERAIDNRGVKITMRPAKKDSTARNGRRYRTQRAETWQPSASVFNR
jgi:hypothetical protein